MKGSGIFIFNFCCCQKYVITQDFSGGCHHHNNELKAFLMLEWNLLKGRLYVRVAIVLNPYTFQLPQLGNKYHFISLNINIGSHLLLAKEAL